MVQIFSHVVNIPFLLGVGNDALPVHGFGPQGSTGDHSDPLQVSKDWAFRMARFQAGQAYHPLLDAHISRSEYEVPVAFAWSSMWEEMMTGYRL